MNVYSKIKKITICILLLSLVVGVGVLNFKKNQNKDKEIVTATALWPSFSFESAVDQASTIVYGKVVEKSDTKTHQTTSSSGNIHTEYYKEVFIEVIDILKGDVNDTAVTYLEMGGETDDVIYVFEGVDPVEINDEYIFFLNKHGAFLSPMTLLPVINGTVLTEGKIAPVYQTGQETRILNISIEAYVEAIKNELKR